MIKLYYYPDNASFAPHLLLKESGLPHELYLVDRKANGQRDAAYLKLNPAGRIPTLAFGDQVVFETPAVMITICEIEGKSTFMPPLGHPNRGKFFQWMAYLNNTLQSEFMVWRYPERHSITPQGAREVTTTQDKRLGDILALLDNELSNKPYLLGDQISACDHFLFMLTLWCDGRQSRPALSFPNLARFMRQMAIRPAVQEVCRLEGIDLQPITAG